jgi:hypothetical protein
MKRRCDQQQAERERKRFHQEQLQSFVIPGARSRANPESITSVESIPGLRKEAHPGMTW